jgi:hypothetical protein
MSDKALRELIDEIKHYRMLADPEWEDEASLARSVDAAESALQTGGGEFPVINKSTWFYKNCKRQRKNNAKICQVCQFRKGIEKQERLPEAPDDQE